MNKPVSRVFRKNDLGPLRQAHVELNDGEADLQTDAAPLKLKVRNTDEEIHKGDAVVIVDFEPEGNLYFVKKAAEQPVI